MHDICFPAKEIDRQTEKGKVPEAGSASAVNQPAALPAHSALSAFRWSTHTPSQTRHLAAL